MNSFPKSERLTSEKVISSLFKTGKAINLFPLRVIFAIHENTDNIPVKMMVAVPKKKFPKATDRNRIKRLIKEAYRINKSKIQIQHTSPNVGLHVAFIFVGSGLPDYKIIQDKIIISLQRLNQAV